MNRSVERRRLAASGVPVGEVRVATSFPHPTRGLVWCQVAPALAGSLCERGLRASEGDVTVEISGGTGDAVLFAISYLDPSGKTAGCAVAVNSADQVAMVIVRNTLEQWSRALRTRRALVAVGSSECPDEANCPSVMLARHRTREYLARGDAVVQIGRASRPLGDTIVVERADQVDGLREVDPDRLSFVVAPGQPMDDVTEILTTLRWRFPRLRGQHPDEWCYDTTDRMTVVRLVAAASDTMLVLGDDGRPDLEEIVDWVSSSPCRTQVIAEARELRVDWLQSAATVGIAAGPSAGTSVVDDVLDVLSGLGPLSVARRRVTTEVASEVFSYPSRGSAIVHRLPPPKSRDTLVDVV